MNSVKRILISIVLLLCWSERLCAGNEGIELYGRIYDGNAKYFSINDAELAITISGKEPEINYPNGEQGEYRVIFYSPAEERRIEIKAIHKDFIQADAIDFTTNAFKKEKNIRMIRKNVFAEENYLKAKKINNDTIANIDEAFSIVETSVELAPRFRYYLFLADKIGERIKIMPGNEKLPHNMASFLVHIEEDKTFSAFSKAEKKDFFTKVGFHLSTSQNLSASLTGLKTYLQFSLAAYDNAISLAPKDVTAYQGKYLVLRKSQNYLDAIKVIETYFKRNDPIRSELTIKGLLVDWVDLIRVSTGFRGGKAQIRYHQQNEAYRKLWHALHTRLTQYRNYYKNDNIKGNKNLKEACEIAKRILDE